MRIAFLVTRKATVIALIGKIDHVIRADGTAHDLQEAFGDKVMAVDSIHLPSLLAQSTNTFQDTSSFRTGIPYFTNGS